MASYLEDRGHVLDSPLSYHFAREKTFRNSSRGGGHWVGLWPDLVLPQGTQTAQIHQHQPGVSVFWGSSETPVGHVQHEDSGYTPSSGGLCAQGLRTGSVYHTQDLSGKDLGHGTPSPRLPQSVETPLLGKARQCPLARLCPLQGGGLSCWA